MHDDGTPSFFNFLRLTGFDYGLCIGAGMLVGYFLR